MNTVHVTQDVNRGAHTRAFTVARHIVWELNLHSLEQGCQMEGTFEKEQTRNGGDADHAIAARHIVWELIGAKLHT